MSYLTGIRCDHCPATIMDAPDATDPDESLRENGWRYREPSSRIPREESGHFCQECWASLIDVLWHDDAPWPEDVLAMESRGKYREVG